MKNIHYIGILILSLALTACFSPWAGEDGELGTISINLGGNARSALPYPPTNDNGILPELEHRIRLQGPAGTENRTLSPGTLNTTFSVTPGLWNVTVESWYQGNELYATGSDSVNVIAGQVVPVTITMSQAISVSVSPNTATVTRGLSQQFSATVNASTNQDVTWTLSGGNGSSSIDNNAGLTAGLLTVGSTETPGTILTVTATSSADSSKSGTATVTVSDQVNAIVPSLSGLPTSGQTYDVTTTATALQVTVTNEAVMTGQTGHVSLSYQWYSSTSNPGPAPTTGTQVGTDSGAYTPLTTTVGTMYYWVVVTNTITDNGDGGTKIAATTSSVVSVTVRWPSLSGTVVITALSEGPNNGEKSLSGHAIMGQTLQAVFTGNDSGTPNYQWRRGAATTLQTGSSNTYVIQDADRDSEISVIVSYSQNSGYIYTDLANRVNVHPGRPISNLTDLMGIQSNQDYILVDNITTPVTTPISSINRTFDGNGKTIVLGINIPGGGNVGLFGQVSQSGIVKNLRLTGSITVNSSNTDNNSYVGAVAGRTNGGEIFNVSSSVNITFNVPGPLPSVGSYVGGLVGLNTGHIRNSYSTGDVSTHSDGIAIAGGIAGELGDSAGISYCWASGAIRAVYGEANSAARAGGIAGVWGSIYSTSLTNCVALNNSVLAERSSGGGNVSMSRIAGSGGTGAIRANNYANVLDGTWTTEIGHNERNGANFSTPNNIASWIAPAGSGPGWTIYGEATIIPTLPNAPTESNPWWWHMGAERPRLWFEDTVNGL